MFQFDDYGHLAGVRPLLSWLVPRGYVSAAAPAAITADGGAVDFWVNPASSAGARARLAAHCPLQIIDRRFELRVFPGADDQRLDRMLADLFARRRGCGLSGPPADRQRGRSWPRA